MVGKELVQPEPAAPAVPMDPSAAHQAGAGP